MPDPAAALAAFEQSPRRAFNAMSDENRATWHLRYCAQEGAEPRVWVLLERTEKELRAEGGESTIHALWVHLANRAGQGDEPDVRAAAALASMAMGLRAG